jgi:hypothetical protein
MIHPPYSLGDTQTHLHIPRDGRFLVGFIFPCGVKTHGFQNPVQYPTWQPLCGGIGGREVGSSQLGIVIECQGEGREEAKNVENTHFKVLSLMVK